MLYLVVHLFIRSLVHSFVRSFIHSFILLVLLFLPPSLPFFIHPFLCLFAQALIQPGVRYVQSVPCCGGPDGSWPTAQSPASVGRQPGRCSLTAKHLPAAAAPPLP